MDFQFKGIDSEGSRHQGSITAVDNVDGKHPGQWQCVQSPPRPMYSGARAQGIC